MKVTQILLPVMLAAAAYGVCFAEDVAVMVIENCEMAGISGFREFWNQPVVLAEDGATRRADHGRSGSGPVADWSPGGAGAPVFDAIHRSLLVRFPSAAEAIAAELAKGREIARVEIVFPFVDVEYFPMGYRQPDGMSFLGDLWVRKQPRWHAIAWPLRQPWRSHPELGPTFNASVNGKRFWARYGAQDTERDRFPARFGPTEVSYENTEGRMDVTALLADAHFGQNLAARLRLLADHGFIVRKWETYDALYNHGGYEYGGAPGHRGIRIKAPRLEITFKPGNAARVQLPPPVDLDALEPMGEPTAVSFTDDEIAAFIDRYKIQQPEGMPDWQWQRVQELIRLGGGQRFAANRDAYDRWIDDLLSTPYRMFRGHHTPLMAEHYLLYGDAMPEPVRQHLRQYFEAWLQPGKPYHELVHNQWGIWMPAENSYYEKTGDWRGNHSFYRDSYTRFISTMNFNHLATTGALLGGAIIDDPYALDDGRHGLEVILARLWAWSDGTTQESIDHYYLGLTLLAQKTFADLGPTPLDRMLGRSIITKTVEELAACYHPALRRFISSSGRTGIAYLLGINEGPNAIMHTLSPKGAMHSLNNRGNNYGMPVAGHDLPPGQVGVQALRGEWAPLWMANIVDEKPLPYEMTAMNKVHGRHREKPLWKRSFLGTHYGMASLDIAYGNETVPAMAQWRRKPDEPADSVADIGTLLVRPGVNRTELLDSLFHGTSNRNPNGSVGTQGSTMATLQHRNRMIVLASPTEKLQYQGGRLLPDEIFSVQTTIGLLRFTDEPWEIYVDDERVDTFPYRFPYGRRITIKDGVSYLAITPIESSDLERSIDVEIADDGKPTEMQGGGEVREALRINAYMMQLDKPLDKEAADWEAINLTWGGYVIEMGDASEYADFDAFRRHVKSTKLDTRWEAGANTLHVSYESGGDTLACGYRTDYAGGWGNFAPTDQCFPYRTVNGEWPYLHEGVERETTVSIMGTAASLEKTGLVVKSQPGRMTYLLTEPVSGTAVVHNPLPDPQYMDIQLPGGARINADGRLAMLQLTYQADENRLDIWYGPKESQTGPEMATALIITGLGRRPDTMFNGERLDVFATMNVDGADTFVIPLVNTSVPPDTGVVAANLQRHAPLKAAAFAAAPDAGAKLLYERGEHYMLTEPRAGAYSFWRLWPDPAVIEAQAPGGIRAATDGRIALQKIIIDTANSLVEIDYAPYLQVDREGNPIENRAKALIVFGMDDPPSAVLHGKPYGGAVGTVEIDGQKAFVIPLFGDSAAEAAGGIEERYRATRAALGL